MRRGARRDHRVMDGPSGWGRRLAGPLAALVLVSALLGAGATDAAAQGLKQLPLAGPFLEATTPVVTSVSPAEGPGTGGNKVTILGEDLAGATAVHFGTSEVALAKPNSKPTKLKVSVPLGTAGTVDVTVTGPGGTSEATPADHYTYTPAPPSVTLVSPSEGEAARTKTITILGNNLVGVTAVHFGAVSVPFTAKKGKVKATISASAVLGTVDVTVTTGEGTSATSAADDYTFTPEKPVVEGLEPLSGPAAGGTSVRVRGEGFLEAERVNFDALQPGFEPAPAEGFEVINDTELIAVSPPYTTANVVVTVATPQGVSPAICPGRSCKPIPKFLYEEPTVASVSPSSGPLAGGTTITLKGSGFATNKEGTVVIVGDEQATSVNCPSTEECTAVTPAAKTPGPQRAIVRIHSNVKPEQGESHEAPEAQFTYE